MNKTEIYTDLINGKIESNKAEDVFRELSADRALRDHFNTVAMLKNETTSNMHHFAPSTSLKNRVFENAGFKPNAASTPILPGILNSKTLKNVSGYILTALVTALITYFLTVPDSQLQNSNIAKNDKSINKIPVSTSIHVPADFYEPDKSTLSDSKDLNHDPSDDEKKTYIKIPKVINNADYVKNRNNLNKLLTKQNLPFQSINSQNRPVLSYKTPTQKYNIKLKGMKNRHNPPASIKPANFSEFNNMGLEVGYEFTDKIELSAYFEQETFFTKYNGFDDKGNYFLYKQQPNLSTFGINMRYIPYSKFLLQPYLNLGTGFNKAGFTASTGLGIKYKAYSNLWFFIGINYDRFWFTHQNNWFDASKSELNYGISFNL